MQGTPTRFSREMTTRDYLRILFRQKWVILLTILTVTSTVFVGLKYKTPVYESSVKILISAKKQVESIYYQDIAARGLEEVVTQSEIVKSYSVLERAVQATELYNRPFDYEARYASSMKRKIIAKQAAAKTQQMAGYDEQQRAAILFRLTVEDLRKKISVEPVRGSTIFKITVQDYNPFAAAALANVISRSYVIFDLEQQLSELKLKYTDKHTAVTQLEEYIHEMEKTLHGRPLPNIDAIGPASVKIVEQANVPLAPKGIPEKLIFVLGAVMSVLLGVSLAFFFEYIDQSFRCRQELEDFLEMPVLACINKKNTGIDGPLVKDVKKTDYKGKSESYRILSEQINYIVKTKSVRTFLFVPVVPNEKSAFIVSNIALFLSKRFNQRTLVVDANIRQPWMHRLFRLPKDPGLCDLLEGKVKSEAVTQRVSDGVDVITCGSTALDPGVLFDAEPFKKLLQDLRASYDVILVDCAHIRDHKEAALISEAFDGVILVVGESGVRRQVVRTSIQPLFEKKAHIIGAVLNNRHFAIPKFLYESI